MLTLEQRRELLENWYHKYGMDGLLDLCAGDLHGLKLRFRKLRYERDDLAAKVQTLTKQLQEATKHENQ